MTYYAHTATNESGKTISMESGKWQPLATHLTNVSSLATQFATPLDLTAEAYLAGLLHDLGKYAKRFQERLRDPAAIRGINHWAAGATLANQIKASAVAFVVDGHHTGIPALNEIEFGIPLRQTISQFTDHNFRLELTGNCPEDLTGLLERFTQDSLKLPSYQCRAVHKNQRFEEALRTRLLFSCLVDADFLDTEAHFDPKQAAARAVTELHPHHALQILKEYLASKPKTGRVNELREKLLNDCLCVSKNSPGLFTLTAPTGSGKTLSSLAFALQHMTHHNATLPENHPHRFRRIIVVIPYTSIIEQTAQIYRDLFDATFSSNFILEHHSAVAPREYKEDRDHDTENDILCSARLAIENWASPIIVTTNVQFFQSLFSNRPSDCRKLHNIGRSVILFDEVQTLPTHLVPSLLSATSLLVRDYGVSAVFMTATQPAFASTGNALPYGWKPREISSNPNAMAAMFRRTHIILPKPHEKLSWVELAKQLSNTPQSLCIVNTTKDARELFQYTQEIDPSPVFHLSARMCPAHRQEKLIEIRHRLDPKVNAPCRLISTQLIEAGVDLDFPVAYRALGPLDSIIQAAGRCNREGRSSQPCPVFIFRPKDGGNLPAGYEQVMRITESFLARFSKAEEQLHQPMFYAKYFAELYSLLGPRSHKNDPVFTASETFNFPKAANECQLIGSSARPVLVKWKRGKELIEKLTSQGHLTSIECREAQRYSVNLYQTEFFDAQAKGYIYQPAKKWNFWVWNSDYDDRLGLGHLDASNFSQ